MLNDDAAQLRRSIRVLVDPAAQQSDGALDAAITVDVDTESEDTVGVAQRHADRVTLPVGDHALDGALNSGLALPRRGL